MSSGTIIFTDPVTGETLDSPVTDIQINVHDEKAKKPSPFRKRTRYKQKKKAIDQPTVRGSW